MNRLALSWKNLVYKPLSMTLSIVLFALGVGLISLLLLLEDQLEKNFEKNLAQIDLVIGAKGSPLQMILSSMYHIDAPTGNITLKDARPFLDPQHPLIKLAVPLATGDSYRAHRIVGTTHDFPAIYNAELQEGRLWAKDFEVTIGADVADRIDLQMGSEFNSSHGFLEDDELEHDHETSFNVVGIFAPTGTVVDQLILTTPQSYWLVHAHTPAAGDEDDHDDHDHGEDDHAGHDHDDDHSGHDHAEDDHAGHGHDDHEHAEGDHAGHDHADHDHGEDDHDGHDHGEDDHAGHDHNDHKHAEDAHVGHDHAEDDHSGDGHGDHDHTGIAALLEESDDSEITAILAQFEGRNFQALNMQRNINENTDLQAATPAIEINRLYSLMNTGEQALRILAIVIVFVSGLSIFISLYSSLKERKYELALMRVMGATPGRLFTLIIIEGLLLAVLGYLAGTVLSHLGMELFATAMESSYRYSFTGLQFLKEEVYLLVGALIIGFIAAVLPAIQASRTDISETLAKG